MWRSLSCSLATHVMALYVCVCPCRLTVWQKWYPKALVDKWLHQSIQRETAVLCRTILLPSAREGREREDVEPADKPIECYRVNLNPTDLVSRVDKEISRLLALSGVYLGHQSHESAHDLSQCQEHHTSNSCSERHDIRICMHHNIVQVITCTCN